MNQYKPWVMLGITEVEYWKNVYIESRREAGKQEEAMLKQEKRIEELESHAMACHLCNMGEQVMQLREALDWATKYFTHPIARSGTDYEYNKAKEIRAKFGLDGEEK